MAGKVTVGLASHWPCVTDLVVLVYGIYTIMPIYGLNGIGKGDGPLEYYGILTFTMGPRGSGRTKAGTKLYCLATKDLLC